MQIDPYLLSLYPIPITPAPRSEAEESLRPLGQSVDDSSLGEGAATPDETPALITALGPTRGTIFAMVEKAAGLRRDGHAPGERLFPDLPGSGAPVEDGHVSQVPAPEDGAGAPAHAEAVPDGSSLDSEELTEEEQGQVEELEKRDREVRRHEQAHVTAGGPYVRGGPQYEYTTGPDQHQYATGGEVDIDTSEVPDDPEGTVRKAQVVYRAALAPAEPSPQDQRVAAQAKQMESEARQQATTERREEAQAAQEETAAETADAEGTPPTGEANGARDVRAIAAVRDGGPARDATHSVAHLDTGFGGPTVEVGQLVDLLG